MGWQDLLQKEDDLINLPWVGGRSLRTFWDNNQEGGKYSDRTWHIRGRLPDEHGWCLFRLKGREATYFANHTSALQKSPTPLGWLREGYLVGNRFIPDGSRVDPKNIAGSSEEVFLVDAGLDRFSRIVVGRPYEGGPLVFREPSMPVGPEDAVLTAFLDEKASVADIPGVTPALDLAFRLETFQRAEATRRRQEEEQRRREEEEKRQQEERRQELLKKLGDGAGRRALALEDFEQAARAALAVGGATLLDVRDAPRKNEKIVRFRFDQRRFECTCDRTTLRILDAGICLTAHYDDEEFEGGTKGDGWFTLESLPGVIRQAIAEGKLVVFRHAT